MLPYFQQSLIMENLLPNFQTILPLFIYVFDLNRMYLKAADFFKKFFCDIYLLEKVRQLALPQQR